MTTKTKTTRARGLAVLKQAYAIISNRRKWTQGTYAKNRHGHSVRSVDETAVRFCAIGSIASIACGTDDGAYGSAERALNLHARKLFKMTAIGVNDGDPLNVGDKPVPKAQAHANILKVFRAAIRGEKEAVRG